MITDMQAACADFGHSSLRVTLAHYMGVNPQELKRTSISSKSRKEAVDLGFVRTPVTLV